MEKSVKITAIVAGAVLAIVLLGFISFWSLVPADQTLSVNGVSQVKALPDLMSLNLVVTSRANSASEASEANSEIVGNVIDNLVNVGFDEKEVTTTSLNVNEEYDWINGKRIFKGYLAQQYLKLEVSTEDNDKLNSAIDASVEGGAMISYINFELSSELANKYKAEATKLAASDAKARAEAIVDGVGGRLGRIISISDTGFGYSPWNIYRGVAEGVAVDVAEVKNAVDVTPGEQTVSGNVQVVYEVKN